MFQPRSRSLALWSRTLRHFSIHRTRHATLTSSLSKIPFQNSPRKLSFARQDDTGGPEKAKSTLCFDIDVAFENCDEVEDSDFSANLCEHEKDVATGNEDRARVLKEQFQLAMEKKKHWMQGLASRQLYAAILKSVADCYAPLYEVMEMKGECPLLVVAADEAKGEHELMTEYQPLRFDDMLTKVTEQEAMALFVINKQPKLALEIVKHRDKLAHELLRRAKEGNGVVLPGTHTIEKGGAVTLGSHLRMFYSWAMSAYALCGVKYYPQMFEIYKCAQDAGVYVSANMNVQYISALIMEQRFDDVFKFYESITRENLPTSEIFYRKMLFAVFVTGNVELLDSILEDMRIKGFALSAVDYMYAIRTYDYEYYFTKLTPKDKRQIKRSKHETKDSDDGFIIPRDTYETCVQRMHEQEEYPERFEKQLNAAQTVISLFDTMVEIDGIAPRHKHLFPRVITAAMYAQDYERVPQILVLHAEHADKPLDSVGIHNAVNALLLLEKPAEAWSLIHGAGIQFLESRSYAATRNIFSYLCKKKCGADIIKLMDDVDKLKLHGVFTPWLIKCIVPSLCASINSVSDGDLVDTITRFDNIFHLRTDEGYFGLFLRESCHYKRHAVTKTLLKQWRLISERKRPIKGSLAKKLLETFEAESDWSIMVQVFEMTDFSRVNSEGDRKVILGAATRAYSALDEPEEAARAEKMLASDRNS